MDCQHYDNGIDIIDTDTIDTGIDLEALFNDLPAYHDISKEEEKMYDEIMIRAFKYKFPSYNEMSIQCNHLNINDLLPKTSFKHQASLQQLKYINEITHLELNNSCIKSLNYIYDVEYKNIKILTIKFLVFKKNNEIVYKYQTLEGIDRFKYLTELHLFNVVLPKTLVKQLKECFKLKGLKYLKLLTLYLTHELDVTANDYILNTCKSRGITCNIHYYSNYIQNSTVNEKSICGHKMKQFAIDHEDSIEDYYFVL